MPAGCDHATVTDDLLDHARRLWTDLARTPVTFTDDGYAVTVNPRSWLCPPGWAGIVTLGGATIAVAPDEQAAATVRKALAAGSPTDLDALRDRLPVAATLGPATLAYCDTTGFRPADTAAVEIVPADHPGIAALLTRVPLADAEECGLDEITSPAFVLRSGTRVVAAAGYRRWPRDTAHVSVLTAPETRGRGLARVAAAAAVAVALQAGLVPQWRARPEPSRRVARALGFRELGAQLSIDLAPVVRTRPAAVS